MAKSDADGVWLSEDPEFASKGLEESGVVVGAVEPMGASEGRAEAESALSEGVEGESTFVDPHQIASRLIQEVFMDYLDDVTGDKAIERVLQFADEHGALSLQLSVEVVNAFDGADINDVVESQQLSRFIRGLVEIVLSGGGTVEGSQLSLGVLLSGDVNDGVGESAEIASKALNDDLAPDILEGSDRASEGHLALDSGVFEELGNDDVGGVQDVEGYTQWFVLAAEDENGIPRRGKDLLLNPPSLVLMDSSGEVVFAELALNEQTAESLHIALGKVVTLYHEERPVSSVRRMMRNLSPRVLWSNSVATLRERKWLRRFTYTMGAVVGVVTVYGLLVMSGVV